MNYSTPNQSIETWESCNAWAAESPEPSPGSQLPKLRWIQGSQHLSFAKIRDWPRVTTIDEHLFMILNLLKRGEI